MNATTALAPSNESAIYVHEGDLTPEVRAALESAERIAWDTETTGLDPNHDNLALCQLHADSAGTHIVRIGDARPTQLVALLESPHVVKVFHHAPFDLGFMVHAWRCTPAQIRCTKIASKILEPSRAEHSLRSLLDEHLDIKIDKAARMSNWRAPELTPEQREYAANDVRYLIPLFDRLADKLRRAGGWKTARQWFEFLPAYALGKRPDPAHEWLFLY